MQTTLLKNTNCPSLQTHNYSTSHHTEQLLTYSTHKPSPNRTCITTYDMQSNQAGLQDIQTDYIQTSRTDQLNFPKTPLNQHARPIRLRNYLKALYAAKPKQETSKN